MYRLPLGALIVFLTVLAVNSAVLFEDDFNTDDEWVPRYGADYETRIEDGKYIVENRNSTLGIVQHSDEFTDFTYTVSLQALTEGYRRTGVVFCWKDAGGYEFTINSNQLFTFGKYVASGTSLNFESIKSGYNSFIDPAGENTLTVVKKGSDIQISCNGVPLARFVEPTFQSGDIGLVINAQETVSYDYVRVTDETESIAPKEYFSDDFNDGDLKGWNIFTQAGTIENRAGALHMNAGTEASSNIVFTSGQYKNAPVKVIVKHEGGSDSSFYGISLLSINTTPSSDGLTTDYSAFHYRISPQKYWAALSSNAESFSPQLSTDIHGDTDTLEITSDYRFIVNGDTLPEVDFGEPFDFNAVAFIAPSDMSVSFDEFEAGEPDPTPVIRKPHVTDRIPKREQFELGGAGIIYDPRGREVARVNDQNYENVLNNLSNGSFIIITRKNGKLHPIRRAVVVK